MATYFVGRKEAASFVISLHDGGFLNCKIFEHWEDTDNTTTARCGDPGVIELKKVVGFSRRDIETLNSSIAGSIGASGIAQIKSKIESTIQKEISWTEETSTSKTSTFSSPKCGLKTMFVYQLVRDFEFEYQRRTMFNNIKSWERQIRERTNVHDFFPLIEEYNEACNCPSPPKPKNFDGLLVIDMGNVSMRAPYRKTTAGIEVEIDRKVYKISIKNREEFLVKIPAAALPEIV